MGVWAALDFLLLAAGAVALSLSIVWKAQNTLMNLVLTDNYLTGVHALSSSPPMKFLMFFE